MLQTRGCVFAYNDRLRLKSNIKQGRMNYSLLYLAWIPDRKFPKLFPSEMKTVIYLQREEGWDGQSCWQYIHFHFTPFRKKLCLLKKITAKWTQMKIHGGVGVLKTQINNPNSHSPLGLKWCLCRVFVLLSCFLLSFSSSACFSPHLQHWAEHEWQGSKCFPALVESLLS